MIEVKMPVDNLEIGMYVTRLDRPWTEIPVLLQGMTINSIDDIELLRSHCRHVFIEIEKEFWIDNQKSGPITAEGTAPNYPGLRENKPFHDTLPGAKIVFDEGVDHVEQIMENIKKDHQIDLERSRALIRSCVDSILTNANALLWMTKIKEKDHYTAEHCLRVGILSIAFGRFLGLSPAELELVGMCGMLHDVGKLKVPDDILNKPGRLSRIEFAIMKQHTNLGYDILKQYEDLEPMVQDTAMSHHERIDGKGYPEGLDAGYLHKFIRLITIVDAYDAITSSRCYKSGSPALDALQILFAERDKHFDKELVEAFIQMVGIYPPGSLVEMTNGEIGIVVSANPEYRLRPRVELVLTSDKKQRPPYIVNLADDIKDKSGEIYSIKKGLANGTYGVDVKEYINKSV
ncbi:HD-GYP domain-containing protein [Oleiphilus messinensis]|nr:HD-GYP domain-containing protein [Oleiphilus messinensis]